MMRAYGPILLTTLALAILTTAGRRWLQARA